jgi:hypothetical protein
MLFSAPLTFRDSLSLSLSAESRVYDVRYTTSGQKPEKSDQRFTNELKLDTSTTLKLRSFDADGNASAVTTASFHKIPHNYTISIQSKYNPQYTAGGDEGIIDGLQADENWRKGGWQGYQAQDFECVVDLQKPMSIYQIDASFLQDTRSWIVLPTKVEFMYSVDGKNWTLMGNNNPTIKPDDYTVQRWQSGVRLGQSDKQPEPMFIASPVLARYIKVKAKNYGTLPNWHLGAGGEAFIFIDEISVH